MKSMNGNADLNQQQPLSRQIMVVMGGAAALLLVPLVAMQFTSEVNWDIVDFFAMGMLLVVAGLLYVAWSRAVKPKLQRIAVGVAVAG